MRMREKATASETVSAMATVIEIKNNKIRGPHRRVRRENKRIFEAARNVEGRDPTNPE
jgi:hypothetical protein